jgi:hypothetical protein
MLYIFYVIYWILVTCIPLLLVAIAFYYKHIESTIIYFHNSVHFIARKNFGNNMRFKIKMKKFPNSFRLKQLDPYNFRVNLQL